MTRQTLSLRGEVTSPTSDLPMEALALALASAMLIPHTSERTWLWGYRGKGISSQNKTGMLHLSQNVAQVDPYSEVSQVRTYGYMFAHKLRRFADDVLLMKPRVKDVWSWALA